MCLTYWTCAPSGSGARRPATTAAGSVGWEAMHVVAPGVVPSGPVGAGEVRRVERFVDHDGVRPVLPGPHQRRGDVARA